MKRGAVRRIALAVAVLSIPAAIGHTQQDTGTVVGVVRIAGAPVAEANVVLTSSASSTYQGSALTDTEGGFSVSEVPVGDVEVYVYAPDDALLARGSAAVRYAGESVTVELEPSR
jgi:hypothetical protein